MDKGRKHLLSKNRSRFFTKKTLLIPTIFLLLALLPTTQVLAVSTSSSSTDSSSNYYVNPLNYFVAPTAAGLAAAEGMSNTCTTGSGLILHCYTPQLMQNAYNFTGAYGLLGGYANAGAGQTIVIFDAYGSPSITSDLQTFDGTFNLPSANLNIVCPQGCPVFNSSSSVEVSWALETTLDVEYSHAMAPAATIILVVAQSSTQVDLYKAEQSAFLGSFGNIWSQSFGTYGCTDASRLSKSAFMANEQLYQAAATASVTLIASAGDYGAQDGCRTPSPAFPSVSPYVLAVGGTHLNINGRGGYMSEKVWNDQEDQFLTRQGANLRLATGGAPLSDAYYPLPSYQSGISLTPVTCRARPSTCNQGTPFSPTGRTTADVSYNADIDGGVLVYWSTVGAGFYIVGGTSAGSPQWAAVIALANQYHSTSLGFVNPILYSLAGTSAFHDVTNGTNSFEPGLGFAATAGYDAPTGLGSPNVGILIHNI